MIHGKKMMITTAIIFLLMISVAGPASQINREHNTTNLTDEEIGSWRINVDISNLEENEYRGTLKVYMVEKISRWNAYNDEPYHFGFLDFAYNDEIVISESEHFNISWNPAIIGDVEKDNLMAIVVLFNEESEVRYSYTEDYPFDAYFVDAAAGASQNMVSFNQVTEDFTHTVFAEEGTATWCPYCPNAAEALYNIYSSGDYPFYYVALVGDQNKEASDRLGDDYNMAAYPTSFFDGGYYVQTGASSGIETIYRSFIQACGQREVPQVNLSVSLTWDPDESPPSITITDPVNGLYVMGEKKKEMEKTIVFGITDILVDASDEESEIVKVEFYINGRLRSEDGFYPFKYSNWKEDRFFGKYNIQAVAYDEAGNQNIDEQQVIRFF